VDVVASYWFRPKRYGYGATPVTWQGWAVTLGIAGAMAAIVLLMERADGLAIRIGIVVVALAVFVALVIIARRRTEGEWRWRWGDDQPNR
jgi:uncharacterized membrane protein